MNLYTQDDIDEAKFRVDIRIPRYIFAPTGNPNDFAIAVLTRPNFLVRFFQRMLLGFRYYEIPN